MHVSLFLIRGINSMKHKKIKIAAALLVVGLIGGVIYNQVTAKKSYDYSDYYVETKTTKKESKK